MRISDWSSDVCSSDLATLMPKAWHGSLRRVRRGAWYAVAIVLVVMALVAGIVSQVLLPWAERHPERIEAWLSARAERSVRFDHVETRSEERLVGKEWVRKCRSRWSPYH